MNSQAPERPIAEYKTPRIDKLDDVLVRLAKIERMLQKLKASR